MQEKRLENGCSVDNAPLIELEGMYTRISGLDSFRLHLISIFNDPPFVESLMGILLEQGFPIENATISSLIIFLKKSLQSDLDWNNHFPTNISQRLIQLLTYEQKFMDNLKVASFIVPAT